jgi:DNA-binding MarR family transcriptional regulator
MKLVSSQTRPPITGTTPEDVAVALLTLIPRMMATLRQHLRSTDGLEVRGGQFRLLMIIQAHNQVSITQAADLIGLTVPTTSKIVDELTQQKLLSRHSDTADRRRVLLSLTAYGESVLETASQVARAHLATLLEPLTPPERSFILCAVETLRPLFEQTPWEKSSRNQKTVMSGLVFTKARGKS